MQCPIVITPGGKIASRESASLRALLKEIDSWPLQVTKYFMSPQDYDDIVKWGSGK